MPKLIYISHANVVVDPSKPVPRWSLSDVGRERHVRFGQTPLIKTVTSVFSSDETKAIEAAEAMFPEGSPSIEVRDGLHENDRSATGFLPPDKFQHMADQFFASPETSVRGWERAVDAQTRIVDAVMRILIEGEPDDVVAVVGHGGVGTLLYCHVAGVGIDRSFDQPPNGGGNVLIMDMNKTAKIKPWTPMEHF